MIHHDDELDEQSTTDPLSRWFEGNASRPVDTVALRSSVDRLVNARRRRLSTGFAAAIVFILVGTIVAMSNVIPALHETSPGVPSGSGAGESGPSGPCARQGTTAVVNPVPDSGAVDASLLEATYKVVAQRGGYVFLQLAGKVQGGPGPNQVLWILGTADPGTHDSNRPPNYGSTRFHLIQQIKPNAAGCWTTALRRLNYECIGGLTFRYYLAILSPQQAQEMKAVDESQDGFTPENIQDRRIPLLSTFDVPTAPNC
jgi:hypothetical protein